MLGGGLEPFAGACKAGAKKFTIEDIVHEDSKSLAREYECAVCRCLWEDPVQLKCANHHIFCGPCVSGLLACPLCRQELPATNRSTPLKDCNQFALRLLNGLKVYCPNHPAPARAPGTNNNGSSTNSSGSEEVAVVMCSPAAKKARLDPGAGPSAEVKQATGCCAAWIGSYGDLLAKHLGVCEFQLVPCAHGCGATLERRKLAGHASECPKLRVTCSICGETMKPEEMEEHRRLKAEQHVQILEKKLQESSNVVGGLQEVKDRLKTLEDQALTQTSIQNTRWTNLTTRLTGIEDDLVSNRVAARKSSVDVIAELKQHMKNHNAGPSQKTFLWTIDVKKTYDQANPPAPDTFVLSEQIMPTDHGMWTLTFFPSGQTPPAPADGAAAAPAPTYCSLFVNGDFTDKTVRADVRLSLFPGSQAREQFNTGPGKRLALMEMLQELHGANPAKPNSKLLGRGSAKFYPIAEIKRHEYVTFLVEIMNIKDVIKSLPK
ncbi:unnamed protein product [Amoebophrya sp. A120]|nr:unnamed protein product [Amoebophrya sp. A120]|eukprot:GSA120T00011940001.1